MDNLKNKVAVVFAASGAIAGAVAKSLAQHGAKVYASGRHLKEVEQLVKEIKAEGHRAEAAEVDAMDEDGIDAYLKKIVETEGKLDIVFNGIGLRPSTHGYGLPSVTLPFGHFMEPMRVHVGSQFLTSRIAAGYMMNTKTAGTIIMLTASLSRLKIPFMAGVSSACSAIEGLTRVLAAELGMYGIKVICLNPTALQETRTIKETTEANAKTMGVSVDEFKQATAQRQLLGTGPTLRNIGELAAFMASDEGAILNSHIIDADYGTMSVI